MERRDGLEWTYKDEHFETFLDIVLYGYLLMQRLVVSRVVFDSRRLLTESEAGSQDGP